MAGEEIKHPDGNPNLEQDKDFQNDPFVQAIEAKEQEVSGDPVETAEDKPKEEPKKSQAEIDAEVDAAFGGDPWNPDDSGLKSKTPKEEAPPEPEELEGEDDKLVNIFGEDEFEKQEEPEAEEPAAEEKGTDDLKNPHDSGKFKERLDRAYERGIKKGQSEKEAELQKEVEKLQTQLQSRENELETAQTPSLSDEEKKELLMLRRRVQAENDPEIREKFDDRIEVNQSSIHEILKSHFPEEGDQDLLKRNGVYDNFENFARSKPEAYKKLMDTIRETSSYDADLISNKLAENSTIKHQKGKQIERLSQEAEEYFQQQAAKQQEQINNRQSEQTKREQLAKEYFKQVTENPKGLLNERKVPKDATAEQKRYIEERNKLVQKSKSIFQRATDINSVKFEDYLDLSFAASMAPIYHNKIKSLSAALKDAQDDLKKWKDAGRTGRSKSHSGGEPQTSLKSKVASMSFEEAVAAKEQGRI